LNIFLVFGVPSPLPNLLSVVIRVWVSVFESATEGTEEGEKGERSEESENGGVWREEEREEDVRSEERVRWWR
jgi:hypothetical protein